MVAIAVFSVDVVDAFESVPIRVVSDGLARRSPAPGSSRAAVINCYSTPAKRDSRGTDMTPVMARASRPTSRPCAYRVCCDTVSRLVRRLGYARSHCASPDRRLEVVELAATMGAVLLRPGFVVEGIERHDYIRAVAGGLNINDRQVLIRLVVGHEVDQ